MQRLFDLVAAQATQRPHSPLLGAKINGRWETLSCNEVWEQAKTFAEGLLGLSISNTILEAGQQEKIALVSPNRPEWVITDLAVQQTGAILTPLYPTISTEEFAFILNQAEVRIIIFADKEMYDRFQPVFTQVPCLKHILTFEEIEGAIHWKSLQTSEALKEQREAICKRIQTGTVATIIYTSGTTGKPKGVMLSHHNIVSNVVDCMPIFHFARVDDRALSFLPLNHIFEKMLTYIYIHAGLSIYYAESLDTIGPNLKEIKPMVFTCVPRLLEKVYEKIYATGLALTGIKRALFFWALALGQQYDNVYPGSLSYRLQLFLANKLVFNKWRDGLGGRIKAAVSGSAPLQEKLIRIFSAAQITVMEGYGLTETSPVITVNRLESEGRRMGTVGPPIRNVEVKIAADGEILCRGPNVMKGYYKDPEQTAAVLDAEGWFYTGDIGVWVEEKFLKITDRKKEMFKTSGGKYVAPQVVENKLRESPYISQIMVVGPGRKFVAALIVPNFEQLRKKWKAQNDQLPLDNHALICEPEVTRFMQEQVNKYNEHLGHIEQVKKFTLLPEEWTAENNILTPKLSLRRKVINERFAREIDAMYS
jgi:long-chain acyl-CoA synthetase